MKSLSLTSEWAKAPGAGIDKLRTATLRGEMNIATLRGKCRSGPRRVVVLARMSHSLSRGAPYGQLRLKVPGVEISAVLENCAADFLGLPMDRAAQRQNPV
jgi:hypothetical protein